MKMKTSMLAGLSVAFAVVVCTAGFGAGRYLSDNRKPNFSKEYVLYVYPGMTAAEVLDSLDAGAGTLRPRSLARCFRKLDAESGMKPGRYVIGPSATSIYVARMLVFGWQTPQDLTLSGTIRTKGAIARKIGSQMMVDSASVAEALDDREFLSGYGFTPEDIFAMILPDTYQMWWTASVDDIFDRLKKEYDLFWTPERISRAEMQGLSRLEVSTLASIVSGETLKAAEYPVIAGVYLNRLNRGMKLQADPTVCYCHDYTLDRVLRKHLAVDSPYNTYKYAGLPPTPINVPPKACIDAVLNPEHHGYIYFCASPDFDGTHRFAVTYGEHCRNAREFQRELTARHRAKDK